MALFSTVIVFSLAEDESVVLAQMGVVSPFDIPQMDDFLESLGIPVVETLNLGYLTAVPICTGA